MAQTTSSSATSTSETVSGSTTTIVETTVEVRSVLPKKVKRQIDNLYPSKSHVLQISKLGDASVFQWAEASTVQVETPYDIIIKVSAVGVNPIDYKLRKGIYPNCSISSSRFPRVLGKDFSGIVVAKGEKVNKVHLLDKIWGSISSGCYAEYLRVNTATEYGVALKPTSITHVEAAGAPFAVLAAYNAVVNLGELPVGDKARPGKRVLIIGASGGVGTFAIQIAKVLGKARVTAVCSGANAELVTKTGADQVIDYRTRDFITVLGEADFDLIIDCVGRKNDYYHKTIPLLQKKGVFVQVALDIEDGKSVGYYDAFKLMLQNFGRCIYSERKFRQCRGVKHCDFKKLVPYFERREIYTVVGEKYPLKEGSKAHEKIEAGHAAGKIVLTT